MQQPPNQPQSSGQYPPNQPYPPQYGQYPPNQPYPPQYGQYPPNQLQPPKRRRWGLGCGIAAGIVVLIVAIVVISASHGGQASTNTTTGSQGGQSAQSAGPKAYAVGQSAMLDGWTVTVNSAKTVQGGQYDSLKAGDVFLELDVSARNETGASQEFSSLISFKLKDATGQSYNETVSSAAPTSPDGNVANGTPIRGTLTYEVPASLKAFTLDFTPGFTSTDTVTWNIAIK